MPTEAATAPQILVFRPSSNFNRELLHCGLVGGQLPVALEDDCEGGMKKVALPRRGSDCSSTDGVYPQLEQQVTQ